MGPSDRAGLWVKNAVFIITVYVEKEAKVLASVQMLLGRPEPGPAWQAGLDQHDVKKIQGQDGNIIRISI